MSDRPPDQRFKDFKQRLERSLESRRQADAGASAEGSAAGLAFRAVFEMVIGIAVAMGLGWMADRYLGTKPWIMLGLLPFGLAAGVVNVMRLSTSKAADQVLGGAPGAAPPPAVRDDEDE